MAAEGGDRTGDGADRDLGDELDDEIDDVDDELEEELSVSTVEKAIMAVSLAITVALFAFAVWQTFAGATSVPPTANVTEAQGTTGSVTHYTVTLRNAGDTGLSSVTVSVDCGSSPRTLTFQNVPSQARRNATVNCPANATDPSAQVTSWIPA